MLQSVRISVGRTWRFATDTASSVAYDLTGYRRRIDELKGGASADFALPWPPYVSRFWTHMFHGTYQNVRSKVLVETLLPLRRCGPLPDVAHCEPTVEFEALLHPFALTALVHLEPTPVTPWPPARDASRLLHTVLRGPLAGAAQVRDGLPLEHLRPLPEVDATGREAHFEDAGRFVIVSAVHEAAPDPGALAYRLATLFDDERTDAAHPLKTSTGAVCVCDDTVGLVLPHTIDRAGQRLRCLHHNLATLLGYLENLATLTPASTTVPGQWFQARAAFLLNHLYLRKPLPHTAGIYRSRLPEAWIDKRGLAPFINALTDPTLQQLPTSH